MSAVSLDLTPKGSVEIETLVNGPIQTNSYAVISDNECVIIDPAWEGERLVGHIRAEHPGVRVLGAVCTQGHADHVGGIAGVRAAAGVDALYELCGKDAAVPHTNIGEQRAMWGIETPDPGEPTRLLAEGDAIEVGDIYLQVIETPGHTGGIVLFAATEQGNIAFVGDTLFPGSHGRTDLAGGDEAAILRSLSKLARLLPPDTVCLTGHGDSTTMARELMQNPFMQM